MFPAFTLETSPVLSGISMIMIMTSKVQSPHAWLMKRTKVLGRRTDFSFGAGNISSNFLDYANMAGGVPQHAPASNYFPTELWWTRLFSTYNISICILAIVCRHNLRRPAHADLTRHNACITPTTSIFSFTSCESGFLRRGRGPAHLPAEKGMINKRNAFFDSITLMSHSGQTRKRWSVLLAHIRKWQ